MPSDQEFAPVIPLFGARSAAPDDGDGGEPLAASENPPARPRFTVVSAPPEAEQSDAAAAPTAGIARLSHSMFGAAPAADRATGRASLIARGDAREDDDDDDDDDSPDRPVKDIRVVSQSALARRGLSVKELGDKLTAMGYADEDVLAELDRLRDLRDLDDRLLAEEVVRIESERKGKGRSLVTSELRRRGIAPEDYLAALDVLERDSERERATELAEKRIRQLSSYDDATVRRRLHSFLSRRGFGGDTVSAAVDAAMHPQR